MRARIIFEMSNRDVIKADAEDIPDNQFQNLQRSVQKVMNGLRTGMGNYRCWSAKIDGKVVRLDPEKVLYAYLEKVQ